MINCAVTSSILSSTISHIFCSEVSNRDFNAIISGQIGLFYEQKHPKIIIFCVLLATAAWFVITTIPVFSSNALFPNACT